MASQAFASQSLVLTDTEAEVLALFDQLQQLELELALLGSQQSHEASSGWSFPKPQASWRNIKPRC